MEDNLNLGSLNLHTQIDRKSVVMNMGDAGNWATRIFSGTKGFLALPFRPLFHENIQSCSTSETSMSRLKIGDDEMM